MCLKDSVAPSSHKKRRKLEENSSPSSASAKPVCLTNVDVGSLMVKRAFKTENELFSPKQKTHHLIFQYIITAYNSLM